MNSTSTMPTEISVALPPASPKRTPLPRREKVLVVMHADGWVEAYADKNVDVRIVQRLHSSDDSGEMAELLDIYTEASLPKCYRNLFVPINLRAQDQCRLVTPDAEAERLENLYYLRELQTLNDEVLIVAARRDAE